jgi:mono/diheme cytochrome c family protein
MRKALFGLIVVTAAMAPGMCLAQGAAAVEAGRAVAQKLCANCHATGASGESPHPGAAPFRMIVAGGRVDNLKDALREGRVIGHPDMPQWRFGPKEADALVAYLRSLSGKG